jgi:hypothetical protein
MERERERALRGTGDRWKTRNEWACMHPMQKDTVYSSNKGRLISLRCRLEYFKFWSIWERNDPIYCNFSASATVTLSFFFIVDVGYLVLAHRCTSNKSTGPCMVVCFYELDYCALNREVGLAFGSLVPYT